MRKWLLIAMTQGQKSSNQPAALAAACIDFVAYTAKDYINSLDRFRKFCANRVLLHPLNSVAVQVVDEALKRGWDFRFVYQAVEPEVIPPAGVQRNNGEPIDLRLLFIPEAESLSSTLSEYFDRPCRIIAPITEHFYKDRPIFVITIPKSGTHLLFQLLSDFDILTGDSSTGEFAPQHWYCPMGRNTHVTANSFLDELSHNSNEGHHHAIFRSPVLFMYRNPLDIAVSEMNSYSRPERSALAHFFRSFSRDDLLLKMIEDRSLAGGKTIRDSISSYIPWLSIPNVVPLSFEELIGAKGDGCPNEQIKTIWSLQLKLHIPGRPEHYGALAFNEDSRTFYEGRINSHRRAFRAQHWQAFRALPQDFMHALGYDINDQFANGYVPRFATEFRRRPLTFPNALVGGCDHNADEQSGVDRLYTYKGHFVAKVRRRFWAVPQNSGPVDLVRDPPIAGLHTATSLDRLKDILDHRPMSAGEMLEAIPHIPVGAVFQVEPPPPKLVIEGYKGFNIVEYDRMYFGIPQWLGPIDVRSDDVTKLRGIVTAESTQRIQRIIDDQGILKLLRNRIALLLNGWPRTSSSRRRQMGRVAQRNRNDRTS